MADVTSPFGFPYPEDTDLVRDGASDIENLAEGVNDYLTGGYLYAGTVYFTSTGNFVKADPLGTGDIGLRAIRVRMVGGGGGSGGCETTTAGQVSIGSGGGGGGYAEKFITDIAGLSSSETVTRGAGGTAGAAGFNAGSAGGTSSAFGVSATGGGGGTPFSKATALNVTLLVSAGGAGSGGDLNLEGESSGLPYATTDQRITSGGGGASVLAAQRKTGTVVSVQGLAGLIYGGGASAAANRESQGTARAGAAGGNGIVIVDCFV
jgi:hypothetical protein